MMPSGNVAQWIPFTGNLAKLTMAEVKAIHDKALRRDADKLLPPVTRYELRGWPPGSAVVEPCGAIGYCSTFRMDGESAWEIGYLDQPVQQQGYILYGRFLTGGPAE